MDLAVFFIVKIKACSFVVLEIILELKGTKQDTILLLENCSCTLKLLFLILDLILKSNNTIVIIPFQLQMAKTPI